MLSTATAKPLQGARGIEALASLWDRGPITVLTGAGCSTESGIPDYRGPLTRLKARNPIQHRAFLTDGSARARYWARSLLGWPRFRDCRPNAAHHALASLERSGRLAGLVTQNVDRLHHKAGSSRLVELHGALAEVRCLDCGAVSERDALQARLLDHNPEFGAHRYEPAPDGDAEIPGEVVAAFRVPSCVRCAGVLKPDVVFFGESVPRPRVDAALGLVAGAAALLVVGSSLAVFSGHRYVLAAVERRIPIAVVNLGESRADAVASVRVEGKAGDVLPEVARALDGTRSAGGR
jgi:NAD-dependent SIR2 family protein deacetylase